MYIHIILGIIQLIIIIAILRWQYKRQLAKGMQQAKEEYLATNKARFEQQIRFETANLQARKQEVDKEIQQKLNQLSQIQAQLSTILLDIDRQRQRAQSYEKELRAQAEGMAKTYESGLLKIAEARVATKKEGMERAAQQAHEQLLADLNAQAEGAKAQVEALKAEVAEYSAKQAAINEAILRQRAIEEQQDFYRVCLSEEAIADIAELQVARQKLKKPEIIDKIIYDTYVAKPVLEMIKRVLQNTTCSGIYKITCQETMEIYIGKSTDIKNRWQQHCKAAFNCGTIASSILHRKMRIYGLENFTFELLEKVPKDQLSEREKYYIDFYKTKETGLNERNG